MNYKKWVFPEVDKAMVAEIADDCNLDPLQVFIALARGLRDPYEIEQFFEKELDFSDPYELSGMSEAVDRINMAIEEKEKILVFGDYDCDGVTATALLTSYLKKREADVDYFVPDRENDGYGISIKAIEKAHEDGVTLIITVDNGINAVAEVERANELGVDVVVTDHHLLQDELPNAVAVVDPHIDEECDWIFSDLCGVGVAFKLVCALESRPPEEVIYEYADLVALGTIADIVPLVSENRAIVSVGLGLINRRQNLGIKAIIEVAQAKFITAGNAAFTLCPRINAAGRMANADIAVKLLMSEIYDDALYYAGCLDRLNAERQQIEQDIFQSACNIIEQNGYDRQRVIVVEGFGWHVGVIGIAASKLVEKYGKPCIVISASGDRSVGSGRSISGFSLFEALTASSGTLVKFGGHELAAGLTVREDDIDLFRKTINQYAASTDVPFQKVKVDCRLKPRALTLDVAKALKAFEPYGAGNPTPLFGVMESQLIGVQPLANGKHVRLKLRRDNTDFGAVMFGVSPDDLPFKVGDVLDLAVTLDVNVYNNTESVSVIVRAVRKSNIDETAIEKQLNSLEKYYSKTADIRDAESICPTRDDIAVVFRYLRTHNGVLLAALENDLLQALPIGKITVAVSALCELKLAEISDKRVKLLPFEGKADLDSADILKELKSIKGGDR